jgi:hypothetical protein
LIRERERVTPREAATVQSRSWWIDYCDALLELGPVDTLEELWLQDENTEVEVFLWKGYRLNEIPQSLKAFLDLFLENGEYDVNRAIWIPKSDSFVSIEH